MVSAGAAVRHHVELSLVRAGSIARAVVHIAPDTAPCLRRHGRRTVRGHLIRRASRTRPSNACGAVPARNDRVVAVRRHALHVERVPRARNTRPMRSNMHRMGNGSDRAHACGPTPIPSVPLGAPRCRSGPLGAPQNGATFFFKICGLPPRNRASSHQTRVRDSKSRTSDRSASTPSVGSGGSFRGTIVYSGGVFDRERSTR